MAMSDDKDLELPPWFANTNEESQLIAWSVLQLAKEVRALRKEIQLGEVVDTTGIEQSIERLVDVTQGR